jgi:hypothetical protein
MITESFEGPSRIIAQPGARVNSGYEVRPLTSRVSASD